MNEFESIYQSCFLDENNSSQNDQKNIRDYTGRNNIPKIIIGIYNIFKEFDSNLQLTSLRILGILKKSKYESIPIMRKLPMVCARVPKYSLEQVLKVLIL